jgi:hypothetical protein
VPFAQNPLPFAHKPALFAQNPAGFEQDLPIIVKCRFFLGLCAIYKHGKQRKIGRRCRWARLPIGYVFLNRELVLTIHIETD